MGSVNIDNTGSGADVTLSSDGTDLLLDGTAIGGGGGAPLYAANESSPSAQPSATGANAVAIGDSATSSGDDSIAIGNLADATALRAFAVGVNSTASGSNSIVMGANATASGSSSVAIGAETSSTQSNSLAFGYQTQATGANAVAIGEGATSSQTRSIAIGYNSTSSGIASTALGPSANASGFYGTALGYNAKAVSGGFASVLALGTSYASGANSFAAAIANNTSSYGATGANSVAIGQLAKATGANGLALGRDTEATATQAVAVGRNVVASGSFSAAFGTDSTASASYSTVIGHQGVSDIVGKIVFAGGYDFSANGDVQQGLFILRSDTTDATAEALTTSNSTAGTTNQIILPNNSAFAFHGTIVARQQASGGTASAAWKVEGLIRREGSAGTTVLVNSATTVLDNTPSWGLALSADTTNGGLKVEATGAASTNIRWVSTIHTTEVTYA